MSESETSPASDRQDDDLPTAEDVRGILRQDAPMPSPPDDVREAMRAEFERHHMISHNGHDICDFTLRVLCALPADSRLALARALCPEENYAGVLRYATELLVSFVEEHCDPAPNWKPNLDLMGVLLQLDNAMTVTRTIKAERDAAQAMIAASEQA